MKEDWLKSFIKDSVIVEETETYTLYKYIARDSHTFYFAYIHPLENHICYGDDLEEAKEDLKRIGQIKLNSPQDVYQSNVILTNKYLPKILDYFSDLQFLEFPTELNQSVLIEKQHLAECVAGEYVLRICSLWYENRPFLVRVQASRDEWEYITDAEVYKAAFQYLISVGTAESFTYESYDPNEPLKELTLVHNQIIELNPKE